MKPMQNQYRFMDPPPAPLRRAHLDNIGLVPGNLLPQLHRWNQLAGELPRDEPLIVLPEHDSKHKKALTIVAFLLKEAGHHVKVVHESDLETAPC